MTTHLEPNKNNVKPEKNITLLNICELNYKHSPKLQSLSRHLLQYFDVTYMSFDCQTYDGRAWSLNTIPEHLKCYLMEFDGYRNDPFCIDLSLVNSDVMVWPIEVDNDGSISNYFNKTYKVTKGITFVYFDENGCYSLAFGGPSSNKYLIDNLIRESNLIRTFKDYLVDNMSDTIEEMNRATFNLAQYVGADFYRHKDTSDDKKKIKQQLLLDMGIINNGDFNLNNLKLTPRQFQCAYLYLKKYTTSEMAKILNIGDSTAGRYLHEVKEQLHVRRKNDFQSKLYQLDKMDFFKGVPHIRELANRQ